MAMTPDQLSTAAASVGYASASRYVARANHLFKGIRLAGKDVLEVGCGAGAWALWAGLHHARKVVGLEPEADGLIAGTEGAFERNIRRLELSNIVESQRTKLQDFSATAEFDVIMLNNTINHLDEAAVQMLGSDQQARLTYIAILEQIRSLTRQGGVVIIADCSRYNLWPNFSLKSPFCPTIEWEKHQSPRLWTELFEDAGFVLRDLRWAPCYPLGMLTANALFAYVTISEFVLRFTKP